MSTITRIIRATKAMAIAYTRYIGKKMPALGSDVGVGVGVRVGVGLGDGEGDGFGLGDFALIHGIAGGIIVAIAVGFKLLKRKR